MLLKRLEVTGFKSFAKKTLFDFAAPVVAIVGPNGSGKSNVAESIRFVLGEQSMKSMRSKRGEDLIWNGSNAAPRANRASAAITFDNSSRFLNIDFDEVTIERTVHRDGLNEYRLNGSVVRLRDIHELLAGANIGQSGHHIISQGEADRVLSASPRDRREILEDALGLKVYQFKLDEGVRKLEKTEENMRQVEALRREIAPHLRFLKKQVEKVEKAEELRGAAIVRYRVYFKREDDYVSKERARITAEHQTVRAELSAIAARIQEAKQHLATGAADERAGRIVAISRDLDAARAARAAAARTAARIDGQLEALERVVIRASVPASDIEQLAVAGDAALQPGGPAAIDEFRSFFQTFLRRLRELTQSAASATVDVALLRQERAAAGESEQTAAARESELATEIESIRAALAEAQSAEREKERELFELAAVERDIRHQESQLIAAKERLTLIADELTRELAEVATLIGREVLQYREEAVPTEVSREEQEREKRDLEKVKIRLEEMGMAGGDEIMKEYREASEREQFLEKELADLTQSSAQLKELIADLEHELSKRFDEGLGAINAEFTRLFSIMFDGGTAALVRVAEPVRRNSPEEVDDEAASVSFEPAAVLEGIDIALTIPRKRIKSLVMLSGGERALTSIALIFAMSLVNPPPFLVLDETDAALDEANSRRYGDMVRGLSDKSQLVVITHNRETMSRAGILYGVTMGGDGVSKVLSVKLEEAVRVAK